MLRRVALVFVTVAACILIVMGPSAMASRETFRTLKGRSMLGESGPTAITFFDDSVGASAMQLDAMKGLTFDKKPVFPIAVHHDDAPAMMYKVLELRGAGLKPVYGWVVDFCDRDDSSCTNRKMFGANFLVDVHKLGWAAIGRPSGQGIVKGTYRVVGSISPNEVPDTMFTPGARSGKEYILCGCTGRCNSSKTQKWQPMKKCEIK